MGPHSHRNPVSIFALGLFLQLLSPILPTAAIIVSMPAGTESSPSPLPPSVLPPPSQQKKDPAVPATPVTWYEDARWDHGSVIRIILGDHDADPLPENITIEWMWKQDANHLCEWAIPHLVHMWHCEPREIDMDQDAPGTVRCDLLQGARYVGMRVRLDDGGYARPVGFRINGIRVPGTVVFDTGITKPLMPLHTPKVLPSPTARPVLAPTALPTPESPTGSPSLPPRPTEWLTPSFSQAPTQHRDPSQPVSSFTPSSHHSQVPLPSGNPIEPFRIKLTFGDGLTASQKAIFKRAARRWEQVIVERLPIRLNPNYDVEIFASAQDIDGPLSVLGRAGPTSLRSREENFIPSMALMDFDVADLERLETEFSLQAVIEHEMAHCLGFGTLWDIRGLLRDGGSTDPGFLGENARHEYMELIDYSGKAVDSPYVPVENEGGGGTQDAHWREFEFDSELMTGYIETDSQAPSPLSRLTVAAMEDLGYVVDYHAAEKYIKPKEHPTQDPMAAESMRPHENTNFFCQECKFTRPLRTIISTTF